MEAIRAGCGEARARRCSTISPRTTRTSTPTFWKEFGRVLKEGVGEDFANSERIAKLLRFASTHDRHAKSRPSRWPTTSARMKEGQDKIYYITADTFAAAKNSPHLEIFRKKGVEVLLLYDRVDEWVVGNLHRVRRQAAAIGGQGRPRSGQARRRSGEEGAGEGSRRVQGPDRQGSRRCSARRCKEVRVTHRLTDSPACLVADQYGMSMNLERLLKAAGQKVPDEQADPRDQSASSAGAAPASTRPTRRASPTGATSCSTRRCWPRAASSTIRPRS